MQSDGTMNLFFLEISGERLGPAAVVIKNGLHLRHRRERVVSVADCANEQRAIIAEKSFRPLVTRLSSNMC